MAGASRSHAEPSDAERAFAAHLRAKAAAARAVYGPSIDAAAITRMLADRRVVRWPTELCFAAEPLQPGEFAHPQPIGFHPADGFCLFVHPHFEQRPDDLPLLVAYHIPSINYGQIVEARHAELYGATLLGLEVEAYYQALCALADGMPRR